MRSLMLTAGLLCAQIPTAFVLPAIAAEHEKQSAGIKVKGTTPSATVEVPSGQMRLIIGGTVGKGILHFKGKHYLFTFERASGERGTSTAKKVTAKGNVYFLERIEDFAGQYTHTAIAQSIMAGAATTVATYKNDRGVSIDLGCTVECLGLSPGGGIAIGLVKR